VRAIFVPQASTVLIESRLFHSPTTSVARPVSRLLEKRRIDALIDLLAKSRHLAFVPTFVFNPF
jgi:hypothetical protein